MAFLAPSPKILGICVVKNEQDIIEPFVRHNLKFLDSLVVLDNGSVDGTKAILEELARELKELVVVDDDRFGHTQSARMTQLLRGARSAFAADYVFALDGDEFIGATDRYELCKILEAIPFGGYGLVPWRTFVLTPGTVAPSVTDPPRSLPWRRREELPVHYKVILRCDGKFDHDLIIPLGNHAVASATGREIPFVYLEDLSLMHFPVRSRDQFVAKMVVGWMAHLSRDPRHRETGESWQKRDNFDRIAEGLVLDDKMLCELSLLYAQTERPIDWRRDVILEDLPFDYVRRYSTGEALSALQLIARAWEQSLLGGSPPRQRSAAMVAAANQRS